MNSKPLAVPSPGLQTNVHIKDYFGELENDYLRKVFCRFKKVFSERGNDGFECRIITSDTFRTHVRFDLSNDNLPKFSLNTELWKEVVSEFMSINVYLQIAPIDCDLMLESNIEQIIGEPVQNVSFTGINRSCFSNKLSRKIFNCHKIISQLNEIIKQLRRDPTNRRLLICSLDPSMNSQKSSDIDHFIFQFIFNSNKLDGCLYLTSCDLDFPLCIVMFSILVNVVGRNVGILPGELVVFVERTRVSGNVLPLLEHLMNLPSPKLKVLNDCCDDLKEVLADDLHVSTSDSEQNIELDIDDTMFQSNPDEARYLLLVKDIITRGTLKPNRTGIDTRSLTGVSTVYNLRDGVIPVLTSKRVFWKGVVEELLWFIKGSTNSKELSEKGVHIWDANGSRKFLDDLGFVDREEGDLGPVYGFQWRHFGAEYRGVREDYSGEGVDQLKEVIENIKRNPKDGFKMVTSWNGDEIIKMVLPPCHVAFHFTVSDGELSCSMYQRSADMGLGVPFNIASYSLLTHLVAHVTGLKTCDFVHCLGDAHVYENHVEPLREQMRGTVRPFPRLVLKREVANIEEFCADDFELIGYKADRKIKMEMAL